MGNTILVVDDFNISNEIVITVLKGLGFNSISCQSGAEALEIIKKNSVDGIITDYTMPGMNGLEFVKALRELPDYKKTPVIFLSSSTKPELIALAKEQKITTWLNKPLDIDQLKKIVRKIYLR